MKLKSFQDDSDVPVAVAPSGPGRPRWIRTPKGDAALLSAEDTSDQEAAEALLERLRAVHHLKSSAAFRPLAGAVDGSRVLVASEPPQGATLRTLLRFVPLTEDQASLVVEGLLAAVAVLHRSGITHGDIGLERVFLGSDGGVRLAGAGLRPQGYPPDFSSDLAAAGSLVGAIEAAVTPQVADNSWSGPVSSRLRGAGQPGSANGALLAWRRGHPMDREKRRRVREQLVALAVNLPGDPATPSPPSADSRPAPVAREPRSESAGRPDPARDEPPRVIAPESPIGAAEPWPALRWSPPAARPDRPASRPQPSPPTSMPPEWRTARIGWRRRWPLAAVVLVPLLLIAGLSSALALGGIGGRGSTPGQTQAVVSPRSTPHSSSKPSTPAPGNTSTGAAPGQIPLLGPPSSSPIQQVQLSASCAGSGSCSVTLKAQLGSHSKTTVTWKLDQVDRCTGQVTTVASGSIPAPAYYTYVEAQPHVAIPGGTAVALVGLAGAPSDAASAPLVEGPAPASCPS